MFARVSTLEGPPGMTDEDVQEAVRILRDQIMPAARQLDGFVGAISLTDRATGKDLTITLWDSEEALHTSEETASVIRKDAAGALRATIRSVDRYEVVFSDIRTLALST